MSTQVEVGALLRYPYPGVRTGGLFLLIVGAGIVAGGLLGEQRMFPVFWIGFAAGFIALGLLGRRLRKPFGALTRAQILAYPAAILLEVALIFTVLRIFREPLAHGQVRDFVFAVLFVVGVHFIVFAIPSGPLCLVAAVLCCANAAVGYLVPAAPLTALWIIDGVIKVGIGIAMLRTPAPSAQVAAGPVAS